jgi:hypothetical protein
MRELWPSVVAVVLCVAGVYLFGGTRAGRGLKPEATVIVVDEEGSYRCADPRRSGRGKDEKGECRALWEGYRPELGIGCGSTCPQGSAGDPVVSARP